MGGKWNYNRGIHEEIGCPPLERLVKGAERWSPSPDTDTILFAFTVKQRRTQRKSDGTLSINGVRFEVPSRFRHFQELYVRYQTWDLGSAYLTDPKRTIYWPAFFPRIRPKMPVDADGLYKTC